MMKKIIGFVTAGLEFNGNSINEKALGGSESAMIYMAREIAKFDNMVFVYCLCDKPGVYDGVLYLPLEEFYKIKTKMFDVLIISRFLEALCPSYISDLTIFWMHDTWLNVFREQSHLCDKVFLMSEYQKSIWLKIDELLDPMIRLTTNGFDSELARETPILSFPEKKNNYIYAARPERGLQPLLENIWPEILKFNPNAQLKICRYDVGLKVPDDIQKQYDEIEELVKNSKNVSFLGFLTKPEFYKALGETAYMVYPCTFPEISCINAIEAQALDCLVITTDEFALSETVKTQTKIKDSEPGEFNRKFIEMVKEYQDESKYKDEVEYARSVIWSKYTWSKIAQDWNNYFNSAFEERYSKYKPQILTRLGHNSDYVTWSKVDPNFDSTLIDKIKSNNLNIDYFISMFDETKQLDPKDVSELPLNIRQSNMMKLLDEYMETVTGKITVLELGCYDGALSGNLYKKHSDKIEKVIAYDAFDKALAAYREIWGKNPQCNNIETVCDDVLNLSSYDLKADLIICGELLEHIVDYKKTLEDIRNQATPGAFIMFSTPVGPWEWIRIKSEHNSYDQDHHLHHFEFSDILQIFDGFDGENKFFITPADVGMINHRNEACGNYIFGYYNNEYIPFKEYDYLLKAKKTRPYFSISTCLIVKNEEENLIRCLNSVMEVSDEIIIVDTGSTDWTKQICKRYTKNIYDLKWEEEDGLGSFERARNYALDKATGDWIFWLDADEVMVNPKELGDYTRSPYFINYGILQKQFMVEGETGNDQYPDRLFRKDKFRFYGVIHELPKQNPNKENNTLEYLIEPPCMLYHFGYLDNRIRVSKIYRNRELLLKNIKKYPNLIDNYIYQVRDAVSFFNIFGTKEYMFEAMKQWKTYPVPKMTAKEVKFWLYGLQLMQKVFNTMERVGELKPIKAKHEDKELLFYTRKEWDLFQALQQQIRSWQSEGKNFKIA